MKPIKPNEVQDAKNTYIPDAVIQCVNELIAKNWTGSSASFLQKDLIENVLLMDKNISREEILKNNLLDFEDLYRKEGWIVTYDSPAYNETYEANFSFKKKQ